MSLGCVACYRPLMKCTASKRINWALANMTGESIHTSSKRFIWQEAEGEIFVSSCGHIFHKKCLFELFTDVIAVTSVSGGTSIILNPGASATGACNLVGECPWCSSQMISGNCVRIHLQPIGNPLNRRMIDLITDNNVIRDHIIQLKEMIKEKEILIEALQAGHLFNNKLNSKKGNLSNKAAAVNLKVKNSHLEGGITETQEMISVLNSKLVTLLEESVNAKETMSELYSKLAQSSPRLARHFYNSNNKIGSDHQIRNRPVYMDEMKVMHTKSRTSYPQLLDKSRRTRVDEISQRKHHRRFRKRPASMESSEVLSERVQTVHYSKSVDNDVGEIEQCGPIVRDIDKSLPIRNNQYEFDRELSSSYPVTPEFSRVIETYGDGLLTPLTRYNPTLFSTPKTNTLSEMTIIISDPESTIDSTEPSGCNNQGDLDSEVYDADSDDEHFIRMMLQT